jgi:hypothetical protein
MVQRFRFAFLSSSRAIDLRWTSSGPSMERSARPQEEREALRKTFKR